MNRAEFAPEEPVEAPGSLPLGSYLRTIRKRWVYPVVGAVIGATAAFGYLAIGQPVTAHADVDITDFISGSGSASQQVEAATETELASSYPVAKTAAAALANGATPAQLRKNVTVTAVDGTSILRIAYTAASASQARGAADAVATAYLTYRDTRNAEINQAAIKRIDDQVAKLRADAEGASDQDRTLISTQIQSLLSQRVSTGVDDATGGQVLSSAAENPVSAALSPITVFGSGFLGGAVLGAAVALGAGALGRRREAALDVGSRIAPVLADTTAAGAPAEAADSLRLARERILAEGRGPIDAIAVIDIATSGAGRTVPDGLADAFSAIGRTGVVCDVADVLGPVAGRITQSQRFLVVAVGPHAALSDALLAARNADGVVLVLEPLAAQIETASVLAAELRSTGSPLIGTVLVGASPDHRYEGEDDE